MSSHKGPTKKDVQTKAYHPGGPTCFILPSLTYPQIRLFYLITAIASIASGGPAGAAHTSGGRRAGLAARRRKLAFDSLKNMAIMT